MKKFNWLSVLFIWCCLMFMPVEAIAKNPAANVKIFYTAMSKGDFALAQKYVHGKELVDLIKMLEALVKEVPDLKSEGTKEFQPYAAGKAAGVKINGNNATVIWSYYDQKLKKQKKTTHKLKKISGVWKIVE